ncbi:MAG: GGDEF domain-containing protein [Rhodocyclaceae bacterium]|nr:MAG: GGDEF domain-containing protein [Rhodocyclaceae bacterium]
MRAHQFLIEVLGLALKDQIDPEERGRHARAAATIGVVFGLAFALFNIFTKGMLPLGLTELAAVVLLLGPAAVIGRNAALAGLAEAMILLASLLILGALVILGGVEGTGLFWVYLAPFLVFFLKGQRRGWWYSLALIAILGWYFVFANQYLPFSYRYSPTVAGHFLLSLGFYTLVAAAFNHLRTRFEEKLQERVEEKTADAKALLQQLQFLATHDPLTKLPNRVRLVEMLKSKLDEVAITGHGLIVCNLRVERLFELGNILGVVGADDLMLRIAAHLERITANRGTLARTRRDEFVIVYQVDRASFSPDGLRRFITERQISVEVQGYKLYIEICFGLALYPDHSNEPQLLLNKAEQAMLQARKSGQQWSIYDEQQEQAFVSHHLLFGRLREAILRQHLRVHYQPQVDLRTGLVLGAEALLRWPDPVAGNVAPIAFIPVAEESGLIRPLTTWLIGECMRECARWRDQGLKLNVSINLSARNLMDPELIAVLMAALKATGMLAAMVNLEITESCFMDSPERALEVIQRIHECGFKLSIDDFGTGYSSLSYLKNLPVHELKIDQGFVRKLLESPGDQAIVSSTIDLAHNFGLSVVAEGIEDEASSEWLQNGGCDIGQGYYYAKPMPPDEFLKYALANRANNGTLEGPS